MRDKHAIIGFKAHTGWATFVAVGGAPRHPEVFARGRAALLPDDDSIPRFVYHEASELSAARAGDLVSRAESAARSSAASAVYDILEDLRSRGVVVSGCALVRGSSEIKAGISLSTILQAHPLIHAAEGKLFRDAILVACRERGLEVTEVLEREVWTAAARACRCGDGALREQIAALRSVVGPPWGADEKLVTAAALAVSKATLATARDRRSTSSR